jgi:hypothetical protein
MPEKAPFILDKPLVTIGATTPIEIHCFANEVHTNVEQDETTTDTFCGSYTSYKPEKWDVTLNALSSFGVDGLWNQIRPLVGTVVPFTVLPNRDAAVGPDNPEMSGDALIKAFPFLDGAVGEASEFDLVLAVQGEPTFDDGGVMTAAASTTTPAATASTS